MLIITFIFVDKWTLNQEYAGQWTLHRNEMNAFAWLSPSFINPRTFAFHLQVYSDIRTGWVFIGRRIMTMTEWITEMPFALFIRYTLGLLNNQNYILHFTFFILIFCIIF